MKYLTMVAILMLTRLPTAQPTSNEARPPQPLSSATISGIAVILMSRAQATPTPVPITRPTTIHWKLTIWRSNSVTTTASSMPAEETRLPLRAVDCRPSIFRPKMNRIAATM